jgi:hypothetical protein
VSSERKFRKGLLATTAKAQERPGAMRDALSGDSGQPGPRRPNLVVNGSARH